MIKKNALKDEEKKRILESCLKMISGISDKEYQKRVWIKGEGPEVDDFDATVCNFNQDGNWIIENYKDFEITDNQYHELVKFRGELDAFCRGAALKYYVPQEFIDTLDWGKIMKMARKVLTAFHYHAK